MLRTSLGHHMTVFAGDHVGDKIARRGLYERENLEFLLALLARMQAPLVLDIGANVGNHSLAFATCAATVHAFEPIPRIHALLAANAVANGLHNIHVHNLALSDVAGTATIHMVRQGNVGASGFDRRGSGTEALSVQKDTGDALLARLGVARVDLVKIDVEAHEVYVLRGLRETLQRDLPLITMEWNDPLTIERLGGSPELAFLSDHYSIHVLGSNFDRGWWQDRPLAFVRRKLTRLLGTRRAVLYAFEPTRLYRNLLLVPKGRESLLQGLVDVR
jgi:FkbM family methyltransferase